MINPIDDEERHGKLTRGGISSGRASQTACVVRFPELALHGQESLDSAAFADGVTAVGCELGVILNGGQAPKPTMSWVQLLRSSEKKMSKRLE